MLRPMHDDASGRNAIRCDAILLQLQMTVINPLRFYT